MDDICPSRGGAQKYHSWEREDDGKFYCFYCLCPRHAPSFEEWLDERGIDTWDEWNERI